MHDFFSPQPIRDASAYLLRFITHDWSDPYAIKILSNLRASALPTTKLITVDLVVPYTCHSSSIGGDIPGAKKAAAPKPLLQSRGEVSDLTFAVDLHVSMPSLFWRKAEFKNPDARAA